MPKGSYPFDYLQNPYINRPLETIYQDLDDFTDEIFEDEPHLFPNIDHFTFLPPLYHEGVFVKGLMLCRGVDVVVAKYPQITDLFHTMAFSMWSAYPWSNQADALFTLYKNPQREAWFQSTHPQKASKILLPFEDSDYTNERIICAPPGVTKDLDVLCVARLYATKNLPVIAQALKIYRKKYPNPAIRMTLIIGKPLGENLSGLNETDKEELGKLNAILGNYEDYIELVGHVNYYHEMPHYYAKAKVLVLASLIEGKNRSIHEAMCCNTPVVCFRQFNQFSRGNDTAFPDGAGLLSYYDPEALADTIRLAIINHKAFTPRQSYLTRYGRINVFNTCLDGFPYYAQHLPGYQRGNHHLNPWIEAAIQAQYQMGILDFIYETRYQSAWIQGMDAIDKYYQYLFSHFQWES